MNNPHTAIREIEGIDPRTLDLPTAEKYAETLMIEIQALEASLGSRRKQQEHINAIADPNYQEWRRKVSTVKRKIMEKYRDYKRYCKQQRNQAIIDRGDFDPNCPHALIRASRELIHRLRREGVDLEDPEMAVLVALDQYVDLHPQT